MSLFAPIFWWIFDTIGMSFAASTTAGIVMSYVTTIGIMGYGLYSALTAPGGTDMSRNEQLQISQCAEGMQIAELFGVSKIVGNIFWYGGFSSTKIKKGGGKGTMMGGGGSTTVGRRYRLAQAVGLCMGPVDEIYTIYENEKVIWDDYLKRPVFTGAKGEQRYSEIVTDRGKVHFYWGIPDFDQGQDPVISEFVGTMTPHLNGVCYAVFDKVHIGQAPISPTYKFSIGRYPVPGTAGIDPDSGLFDPKKTWTRKGMNPAHILAGIMMASELPESGFEISSWQSVEDDLWVENMMMNTLFTGDHSTESILAEVLQHIDGMIDFSIDSTFRLKLFRKNLAIEDIPEIAETDVLEVPGFSRADFSQTINEVKATFCPRVIRKRPEGADFVVVGQWGRIQRIANNGDFVGARLDNVLGGIIPCESIAHGLNTLLVGGGQRVRMLYVDDDNELAGYPALREPATEIFTTSGVEVVGIASDGDTFMVVGVKAGGGVYTAVCYQDGTILYPEKLLWEGYHAPKIACNGDYYLVTAISTNLLLADLKAIRLDRENNTVGTAVSFQNVLADVLNPRVRSIASDGSNYLVGYAPQYIRMISGNGRLKGEYSQAMDGLYPPSAMVFNGLNFIAVGGINKLAVYSPQLNEDNHVNLLRESDIPAQIPVEEGPSVTTDISLHIAFNSKKYFCCGPNYGIFIELKKNNAVDTEDMIPDDYGGTYYMGYLPLGDDALIKDVCCMRYALDV
jgi:hypothetical protein